LTKPYLKDINFARLLMGANMDVCRYVLIGLITFDFLPLVAFRCKVEGDASVICPFFLRCCYVLFDITAVEKYTSNL